MSPFILYIELSKLILKTIGSIPVMMKNCEYLSFTEDKNNLPRTTFYLVPYCKNMGASNKKYGICCSLMSFKQLIKIY